MEVEVDDAVEELSVLCPQVPNSVWLEEASVQHHGAIMEFTTNHPVPQ